MTDEELNIAICEARGWVFDHSGCNHTLYTLPGSCVWIVWDDDNPIPDHINGIEALGHMHEAEKLLKNGPIGTHSEMSTYRLMIYRSLEEAGQDPVQWGHATARQRAIAFVKTFNLIPDSVT